MLFLVKDPGVLQASPVCMLSGTLHPLLMWYVNISSKHKTCIYLFHIDTKTHLLHGLKPVYTIYIYTHTHTHTHRGVLVDNPQKMKKWRTPTNHLFVQYAHVHTSNWSFLVCMHMCILDKILVCTCSYYTDEWLLGHSPVIKFFVVFPWICSWENSDNHPSVANNKKASLITCMLMCILHKWIITRVFSNFCLVFFRSDLFFCLSGGCVHNCSQPSSKASDFQPWNMWAKKLRKNISHKESINILVTQAHFACFGVGGKASGGYSRLHLFCVNVSNPGSWIGMLRIWRFKIGPCIVMT